MPSAGVLDIPSLLEPIPGAKPAGEDPRADPSPTSAYQAVREARKAARAAERAQLAPSENEEEQKLPDWKPVLTGGIQVLRSKAKDLEVTAYVIEALLRQHGYAGLRDGFRLARELVVRYWDDLYPTPDEDGVATRVAPLVGLNGDESEGTLILPMTRVPVTQPTSFERFSLVHYQEALSVDKISDPKVREKKVKDGAITRDMFQRAVAETNGTFYVDLVGDLEQCQQEFAALSKELGDRCGTYGVPSSNIRSALEKTLDIVKDVARAKLPAASSKAEPAPADAAAAGGQAAPNGAVVVPGAIQSREDAFRTLLKVADYFRETEPHSVISYSLEQIVTWGRMSLPELLAELIPEDAPRKNLFKQVGIKPPEPAPKEAAKK